MIVTKSGGGLKINGTFSKNLKTYIQQQTFTRGHPPSYYPTSTVLDVSGADGTRYIHRPMVVCEREDVTIIIRMMVTEGGGSLKMNGSFSKNFKTYIQQQAFTRGHPPSYYPTSSVLDVSGADETRYIHRPMVVCDRKAVLIVIRRMITKDNRIKTGMILKTTKHTTAGVRLWSPTKLLLCQSDA